MLHGISLTTIKLSAYIEYSEIHVSFSRLCQYNPNCKIGCVNVYMENHILVWQFKDQSGCKSFFLCVKRLFTLFRPYKYSDYSI